MHDLVELSKSRRRTGPASTMYKIIHFLNKELTQILQEISTCILSSLRTSPNAGVSASPRPETPELGNYGNFWMTSDQKMNDFI